MENIPVFPVAAITTQTIPAYDAITICLDFLSNSTQELSKPNPGRTYLLTPVQALTLVQQIQTALQKLEKRKFIERTPDEKDQRVLRIQITEAGKECLLSMRDIDVSVKRQLFQSITEEERMLLRRLFIQMRENMMEVETLEHPPIS